MNRAGSQLLVYNALVTGQPYILNTKGENHYERDKKRRICSTNESQDG